MFRSISLIDAFHATIQVHCSNLTFNQTFFSLLREALSKIHGFNLNNRHQLVYQITFFCQPCDMILIKTRCPANSGIFSDTKIFDIKNALRKLKKVHFFRFIQSSVSFFHPIKLNFLRRFPLRRRLSLEEELDLFFELDKSFFGPDSSMPTFLPEAPRCTTCNWQILC